ncbi:MAG: YveK family protein [Clostridiaceae bacterium]
MDYEIDNLTLKEFLKIIRKRIFLILVVTFITSSLSAAYYYKFNKPIYTTRTSYIVGKIGDKVDESELNNRNTFYSNMMNTFKDIATSFAVSEDASKLLNGKISSEEILESINVQMKDKTLLLEIEANSDSSEKAKEILNSISESFIKKSNELYPSVQINVLDTVGLVSASNDKSLGVFLVLGLLIGLAASLGLIFLMEYLCS